MRQFDFAKLLCVHAMAALAFLSGCGGGEGKKDKTAAERKPAADRSLGAVQSRDEGWGDVVGRVTWGGDKIPPQRNIDITANPDKAACEKDGPLKDETWVVNPSNKGLRNVFVWLEAPVKGEKLPIHPKLKEAAAYKIVVDQPACAFIPHAVALREGQILVAKNSSGIAHNFKWTGNPTVNPGGNVLLPPGASREIDDLKADRIAIKIECSIHPWMNGWARVYDHPYFAATDADGKFKIANAPAGEFRLKVWAGSGGWLGGVKGKDGQPIAIKAGETNVGDLPYPPPAN